MTIPGQIGRIVGSVPGQDTVLDRLAALEKAVTALATARSADYTTVGAGGSLKVDGTLAVSGDLEVSGNTTLDGTLALVGGATLTAAGDVESDNYVAGSAGWKLDGTTGNMEINDVTIRGGIIGNNALSDPVEPAVTNGTDFNNTYTTSFVNYLTKTVTVPSGFSTALVLAIATVTATTSTFVALNCKVNIAGTDSSAVETSATNAVAVCPVPFARLATGLSGTFNIQVFAEITGTMTASSGQAYLSASVLFLR